MEALLGSMPSCAKTRCRRGAGGVQLQALGFTWPRGLHQLSVVSKCMHGIPDRTCSGRFQPRARLRGLLYIRSNIYETTHTARRQQRGCIIFFESRPIQAAPFICP
jgi:hypothetical protein